MDLNGANLEAQGPPPKTRIDVFTSKRTLAALFLFYIGSTLLLCLLGNTGPEVFKHVDALSKDGEAGAKYWKLVNPGCDTGNCKFQYTVPIIHMIPEMQLIYMKVKVKRPSSGTEAITAPVVTTTSVIGCDREHCVSGGENDTSGQAATNPESGDPQMMAKADMVFVNPDFTWWVMGWKVVFLICTLVVMFCPITLFDGAFAGYFVQQRHLKLNDWSNIQCWIGALLVVLLFFNDPFFALQFGDGISSGVKQFLVMESIVLVALFVSLMLCFMLVSTGTIISSNKDQFMGGGRNSHKLQSNYIIAKVGLCSLIFAFLFFYYVIARMYNTGSPQYDNFSDDQSYMSFQILLIICMVAFSLWYVVSVCKCIMNVRMIERGYLALLVITVIAAILMVIGVSIGALYILPNTSFKWMFFYGSCNVTVWVLSWAFAHNADEDEGESSWALDAVSKGNAQYSVLGGDEPLGGGAEGLLSADI